MVGGGFHCLAPTLSLAFVGTGSPWHPVPSLHGNLLPGVGRAAGPGMSIPSHLGLMKHSETAQKDKSEEDGAWRALCPLFPPLPHPRLACGRAAGGAAAMPLASRAVRGRGGCQGMLGETLPSAARPDPCSPAHGPAAARGSPRPPPVPQQGTAPCLARSPGGLCSSRQRDANPAGKDSSRVLPTAALLERLPQP